MGSTQQEEVTIINAQTPNASVSSYIKQILLGLKGVINSSTIMADFNNPEASVGRSMRQTEQ